MNNVTDISEAGRDAAVLTDAGSGGLIGRAVLADRPLVEHLADDETPRYVLRNKKQGVTVERPDGTEEYEPDRGHSGAAVLTDVRVLFAVGRSDGDRTVSVPLADVVDVRTEDGLLGGAFVIETLDDERYRFPCRGDLDAAREFLDAAVGVWTRAQRHVDEAREQVERLRSAFESGDADVVLAAVGDVEATLAEAREAAEPLDRARARVDERAEAVRADLAGIERRARAEYAEQARERAHVRWDDGDYETALDALEEADKAYAAALESAGAEPPDSLLAERRETLADERDRLAATPVARANHAADTASATDDPGAAVDWWGTAVERYDIALSLDWGRDERRFAGNPSELRDDLAEAARELVAACCELAREHVADGDDDRDADPEAAAAAYDLAADALAEAREVARERVPGATDEIDRVEATLVARCEELSERTQSTGTAAGKAASPDGDEVDTGSEDSLADNAVRGDPDATGDSGATDDVNASAGTETTDDGETPPDAVTDPAAVDPDALPSLVARVFEAAGWSTTVFGATTDRYDLVAATDGPAGVTLCVWTVHPAEIDRVNAATVDRYAAAAEGSSAGDLAAVCSAAPVAEPGRARADERGLKLLDPADLRDSLADLSVPAEEF